MPQVGLLALRQLSTLREYHHKSLSIHHLSCRQGEHFDRERHAIGTEVKAITYSAMQIREESDDAEVFVIVDI